MTDMVFNAKDRHGADMEFEIKPPSRSIEMEADMNYRKAYGEALKEGLLPREALRKIMRDSDIWSDEHEKELKESIAILGKLEAGLSSKETSGDKEACIKIAGDLARSRRRMWELVLIQQSAFMSSSCEAFAEMIRIESQLAASVVIKASNQRYWKNYKEYVLERDTNEIATVAIVAMEMASADLNEQQTSITENHPEQRWLKKYKLDTEESRKAAAQELAKRAEKAIGTSDELESPTSPAKTNRKKTPRKRVAKKPR